MNPLQRPLPQLHLDLGPVRDRAGSELFLLRIEPEPLARLVRGAQAAYRVAELLRIERPGDLWPYLEAVVLELPQTLRQRLRGADAAATWPLRLPLQDFARLFWCGEDATPADDCWHAARDGAPMRDFLIGTLNHVRCAQRELNEADPLIGHILRQCRAHQHPDDFLPLATRSKHDDEREACGPEHIEFSPSFYAMLDQLLLDPSLRSAAYRGNGDYGVLRRLATAQRRRAGNDSGEALDHHFELRALVNRVIRNEDWDARIWFQEEGLGHGDLLIETDAEAIGGAPLGWLIDKRYRRASQLILASRPQQGLQGYEEESGDGWFLYRLREAQD